MLSDLEINPDGQPPLPFAAAQAYAQTVTAWAQQPLPAGVVAHQGLAYGPHRLQRCDVYVPHGARAAAVLVFWHGGGWTNGYRHWVRFMAGPVTARGLVLVAPSYRLAPEHPLPAAHHDALALLAWLRQQAGVLGASPDRLLLAGHSAGGQVAALAALRRADRRAAGVPDSAILGCLPISGILDLHDPTAAPGSLEERVYTTVLRGQDPVNDTLQSPLYWAAGNALPFHLSWGERDSPRAIKSNRRLLALLQAQAGPADGSQRPGRDHFQTHTALAAPADAWYDRLAAMAAPATPAESPP